MTTVVNLQRVLDRKMWEPCSFAPHTTGTSAFCVSSDLKDQCAYLYVSNLFYQYDPYQDSWQTLPTPTSITTGTCGAFHPWGPQGTATGAGTTTSLSVSFALARSLAGYTIRFTSGANAGQEVAIKTNTTSSVGPCTVTLATPLPSPVANGDGFIIMSGRVWVYLGGTNATTSLRYYDVATNVWSYPNPAVPFSGVWGTEGRLVSTASMSPTQCLVSGTSTGANTSTTLQNTGKTWMTNNWANYMVRIVSGTGAGQYRTISSNTANTLTVSTAWTTIPDATSVYQIEGNSDYLYLLGNNATAMYRYSLSGNAWTLLAPSPARGGNASSGCGAHWVNAVSSSDWSDENNTLGSGFQNGRYIYSFRGNTSANLDVYDIALNAWSSVYYAPAQDTIVSGTSYTYLGDYIYVMLPGGRLLQYHIYETRMEPSSSLFYLQGGTVAGDKGFNATFTDGTTQINYVYFMTHNQSNLFRQMVF